jgi:hypothetical protein
MKKGNRKRYNKAKTRKSGNAMGKKGKQEKIKTKREREE